MVPQNVYCSEPDDPDPMPPQIRVADCIVRGILAHVMRDTVDFDREMSRGAEEVDDERA